MGLARSPHRAGADRRTGYGLTSRKSPLEVGHHTVIPTEVHSSTNEAWGSDGRRTAGVTAKP